MKAIQHEKRSGDEVDLAMKVLRACQKSEVASDLRAQADMPMKAIRR